MLGGLFGGNQANSGVCAVPSLWSICEKQCAENIELTKSIYETRITDLKEKSDLYLAVNSRLVELEKKDAALAASLPLAMQLAQCNSERYTDNKVNQESQSRERVDWMLQSEISKKIDGTMGLPYSSLITGVPQMPRIILDTTNCGCNGTV